MNEEEAVVDLCEAGGRVTYDTDRDWCNPQPKPLPHELLRRFIGEQHFRRVIAVDLCGVKLTAERLELVLRFESLESLDLVGKEINDEILERLSRMKRLRRLTLTDTSVSEKGIARLQRKMPRLAVNGTPGSKLLAMESQE